MQDVGQFLSGLFAAPIVRALGITYVSFGRLPHLLAIEAGSRGAVLLLLYSWWFGIHDAAQRVARVIS